MPGFSDSCNPIIKDDLLNKASYSWKHAQHPGSPWNTVVHSCLHSTLEFSPALYRSDCEEVVLCLLLLPQLCCSTDSAFIAAARGWTLQSWTQAAVGQVGSLTSLKLFGVSNIPPGPPGHFQIFVSGCKWILCIPVWHMDCEKLFRDILPARRKTLNSTSANTGPVGETIKFCELWTNFYYFCLFLIFLHSGPNKRMLFAFYFHIFKTPIIRVFP